MRANITCTLHKGLQCYSRIATWIVSSRYMYILDHEIPQLQVPWILCSFFHAIYLAIVKNKKNVPRRYLGLARSAEPQENIMEIHQDTLFLVKTGRALSRRAFHLRSALCGQCCQRYLRPFICVMQHKGLACNFFCCCCRTRHDERVPRYYSQAVPRDLWVVIISGRERASMAHRGDGRYWCG